MLTGQLALLTAGLFAGAALYITIGEQPARLALDDRALLAEWQPAYKRGTAMQFPLAVIGFLLGIVTWWWDGNPWWIVGALLMFANAPFTFLVIMPVNDRLMATPHSAAGPESRDLIERWGRLHAFRTALGFGAAAAFVTAALT